MPILRLRALTPREFEIRTNNRCNLHPIGKKQCTCCELVFDKNLENFDVHRIDGNGKHRLTGKCKSCCSIERADRNLKQKNDIVLYSKRLIASIRWRAKQECINFNLTSDHLIDMWKNQNECCYYTGEQMDLLAYNTDRKSPHYDFPSVDKLNPLLGYVVGNVVWCKWVVNRMKSDLTLDEFIGFCCNINGRFNK